MQVSITLTAESSQWKVKVACGPDHARTVHSFGAASLDFTPWIRPGLDGLPAPDNPDYAVLSGTAGDLQNLTGRVAALGKTPLEPGDLVAYGRLLFASVLAPFWDTVVAEARAAHELIELALHLPSVGDSPLQTVPWELLHDGRSFLVTHNDVEVAITRRIPSDATTPDQIAPPARILFAIGAELSDPAIQAGAEFLGLMRDVERRGSKIASYIVERASPGRLTEAVKQFKPDVVHFIAHGHLDSHGVPALRMRPEEDAPSALAQYVTADTLYTCVSAGERIPPMVVLAACESGAVSSVSSMHGMLLAENLVSCGIPVVVAMAGSVADQACRLFTRRFGTILATGGPLLQAAADARLAAYRRGGPPSTTIDWALPSVFLSDGVPHDYQPVAVAEGISVSRRIEKYDFAEGPVFCGRSKFFDRYDDLMSPGPLNVLAIYSRKDTRGLGKSRILREYGTRALLDGHVPCVVGLDGKDRPTDPRRFAKALLTSVTQSRRLFHLDPPVNPPALLKVLCFPGGLPSALPPAWRDWRLKVTELTDQACEGNRPLDCDSLSAAIAADLATLIEDARAKHDPRIGPASRVLMLLDTVEEWGDTVDLIAPGILSQHGLGDEDEAVPVVMAFRAGAGVHDALFEGLIRFADGKRWIDAEKLEPLAEGDEEGLAYRWILLNANPAVAPSISEKVYTVVKPDGQWRTLFGIVTDRVPAKLSDLKFYSVAKALLQQEELAEGDDDEALDFLLKSRS